MKVLSYSSVCLSSHCRLVSGNGIAFTAVQPISKSSAVTGCLRLLLMSASINLRPSFYVFPCLTYMFEVRLSSPCPVGQRRRMVHVIRCSFIAVLLVLERMVLCWWESMLWSYWRAGIRVLMQNHSPQFYCREWYPLWWVLAVFYSLSCCGFLSLHTCVSVHMPFTSTLTHLLWFFHVIVILLFSGSF